MAKERFTRGRRATDVSVGGVSTLLRSARSRMLSLRTTLPKSSKMNGFVRPFAYVRRPANRIIAGQRRLGRAPGGVDVVAGRRFFERAERVTAELPLRDTASSQRRPRRRWHRDRELRPSAGPWRLAADPSWRTRHN